MEHIPSERASGRDAAIRLLKLMQNSLDLEMELAAQEHNGKKVPILSKVLKQTDKVGEHIVQIGDQVSKLASSSQDSGAAHGFQLAGLVVAAFDFVRIPLVYLTAYLLKEKVPITLSNNARWLYSAFLLGLTITSLVVPGAALVISFVLACAALSVGLFLLGRVLNKRFNLGREQKKLQEEMHDCEDGLVKLQQEAQHLEQLITTETKEEKVIILLAEVASLKERYQMQKNQQKMLADKQDIVQQKIDSLGAMKVVDRIVGVGLGALFVAGLVVSLFFPPAGLILLATAAITSGAYLLGRLATPLFRYLGQLIFKPTEKIAENKPTEAESVEPISTHESTADVFRELGGIDAVRESMEHLVTVDLDEERIPSSAPNAATPPRSKPLSTEEEEGEGEQESEGEHPRGHQ